MSCENDLTDADSYFPLRTVKQMSLRKIISAGLVCLITINGMADAMGTLLMCLHMQDSATVSVVNLDENCCHEVDNSRSSECGDCTDVRLQSVDAQVIRPGAPAMPHLAATCTEIFPATLPFLSGVEPSGPNPARAPPATHTCLMVARTVVLRI